MDGATSSGSFVKEMVNSHTDCFVCRAISSFALFAGGAYLFQHRNNFGRVNSYFQTAIGAGLVVLSFTRALGLPPFENDLYFSEKKKLEAMRSELDRMKEEKRPT